MAPNNAEENEDFDAGEKRALDALARHYATASEDIAPPQELSASIRAAAEKSVREPVLPAVRSARVGWLGWFAFALSAVLTVALVMNVDFDNAQEGLLSPASVSPDESSAVPFAAPIPGGTSGTLPAPPISKAGVCAVRAPDADAPRAYWEAEFQRLADQGCDASKAELQKMFSDKHAAHADQKLTGIRQ